MRKESPVKKAAKKSDNGIRMTIFVESPVYTWLVREKRETGQTYGDIVSIIIRAESDRRKSK